MPFGWFRGVKMGRRPSIYIGRCYFSTPAQGPPWKIMFFGADKFSLFSLNKLMAEYRRGKLVDRLEVVTTVKAKPNLVKLFCDSEKLQVHPWPLSSDEISGFDLGLAVSFGHLIPEHVISSFKFGILNVHASLLPRWRGAAPIIYALAHGDNKTGITIMKIKPSRFDVGDIVSQAAVEIAPDMTLPVLYENLGELGAHHLIKTLENLPNSLEQAKPQRLKDITYAPKITADFGRVDWRRMTSRQIFNLERALVGLYHVTTTWKDVPVKLIGIKECDKKVPEMTDITPGLVQYDKHREKLQVFCSDCKFIIVDSVGVTGKKVMTAKEFANGYLQKESPYKYFK